MDASAAIPLDVPVLGMTALTIGFVHTLLGPDHYIPFVAMSRVGGWSMRKTIGVTLLCGAGHVGGSVVLGLIGVALGVVVLQIESIESFRGDLAGWLLVGFGSAYFLWGLFAARSNRPHTHLQFGPAGADSWQHEHGETAAHDKPLTDAESFAPRDVGARAAPVTTMTPWVLLVIFVFGPCESLIPLLMYPAAKANAFAVLCVTGLFALATLATMTVMVVMIRLGVDLIPLGRFHQYSHALAGLAVLASGLAVTFGL